MKILETKPITLAEAKELLSSKKEDELGYEQKITLEYLRKFVKISKEDAEKTAEELRSSLDILKEHQIATLIGILPEDKDAVKTLFMKERVTLTDEQISKILSIIDKIRPKKK